MARALCFQGAVVAARVPFLVEALGQLDILSRMSPGNCPLFIIRTDWSVVNFCSRFALQRRESAVPAHAPKIGSGCWAMQNKSARSPKRYQPLGRYSANKRCIGESPRAADGIDVVQVLAGDFGRY